MANLNATLYGNPIINENNIEFNGSNQYAMTQNKFTYGCSVNTNYTLELRFNFSDYNGHRGLLQITNGSRTFLSFILAADTQSLFIMIYDGNLNKAESICNVSPNVDYTLTVVRDSSSYHIYIDGILIVSYASASSSDKANCYLYIGAGTTSYSSYKPSYYLAGKVYAFRYYHGKALTQAEVESNVAMDKQRFA